MIGLDQRDICSSYYCPTVMKYWSPSVNDLIGRCTHTHDQYEHVCMMYMQSISSSACHGQVTYESVMASPVNTFMSASLATSQPYAQSSQFSFGLVSIYSHTIQFVILLARKRERPYIWTSSPRWLIIHRWHVPGVCSSCLWCGLNVSLLQTSCIIHSDGLPIIAWVIRSSGLPVLSCTLMGFLTIKLHRMCFYQSVP